MIYVCIRCKFYYGTRGGCEIPPTEHLAALIKPPLIHSGGGWAEGCRTSEAEAAEQNIEKPDLDWKEKIKHGGKFIGMVHLDSRREKKKEMDDLSRACEEQHLDGTDDGSISLGPPCCGTMRLLTCLSASGLTTCRSLSHYSFNTPLTMQMRRVHGHNVGQRPSASASWWPLLPAGTWW